MLENAWKQIQQFLATTFSHTDRGYADAAHDVACALNMSRDIHAAIWKIMDEVRCAYYHAHYNALYHYYDNQLLERKNWVIRINPSGIISTSVQQLPPNIESAYDY